MIAWLRNRRFRVPLAVSAGAILTLAVSGCSGEPDPTPEVDDLQPPPLDSPLVKAADAKLPDAFPDDVEIGDGTSLMRATEEDGKLFVQMSSEADYEETMDFYEKSLRAKGWNTERRYDPSDKSLGGAVYGEKDGRAATIFITNTGEGTLVDFFIEPEAEPIIMGDAE